MMSSSLYYVRKKTAITHKHCLQTVLILSVWDDVNPVFDHSPKAIFQIYQHYKTVWWKTHLLCSDYRLLQPNEQTFVLSTSPEWTTSSWLWSYLKFATNYFSCQKVTLKYITHQMWEKLLTLCPAGRGGWGRLHLTTTSWVYKSDWGPFLHVILTFSFFPHFVLSSSTSHCSAHAKISKLLFN